MQQFTNLYELSKTLRFELKPVWKTKELLDEQNELFETTSIDKSDIINWLLWLSDN